MFLFSVLMTAYRLYTVIPRLLDLINDLTNWYIRFNRRRLKGEGGEEDTRAALNTLHETLQTLCLTMSSFTPYICETIYQGLMPSAGAPRDPSADVRSVHFVPFPEVRAEYFDTVIERQVQRLKTVIDLGRVIREKKLIKIRVGVLVYSADARFLSRSSSSTTRTPNTSTTFARCSNTSRTSSTLSTSSLHRTRRLLASATRLLPTGEFWVASCARISVASRRACLPCRRTTSRRTKRPVN